MAVLQVYTDGSHKGRWGAWAFLLVANEEVLKESSGRARYTSSNRMEFQAALEALVYLSQSDLSKWSSLEVLTDSRILIEAIEERIPKAKANNWQKANGAPFPNVDLLKKLDSQLQGLALPIQWQWIKAHSGIVHNERCDQLCIQQRGI